MKETWDRVMIGKQSYYPRNPNTFYYKEMIDKSKEEYYKLRDELEELERKYKQQNNKPKSVTSNSSTHVRSWNDEHNCNYSHMLVEQNTDGSIYMQMPISPDNYSIEPPLYTVYRTSYIKAANHTPLKLTIYIYKKRIEGRIRYIYEYTSVNGDNSKICKYTGGGGKYKSRKRKKNTKRRKSLKY